METNRLRRQALQPDWPAGGQQSADFVRERLGVLIECDRDAGSELMPTLRMYLNCGGGYNHTAFALGIHRSTLRYRLMCIRQLTGYDLKHIETLCNVRAAMGTLRLHDPTA